MALNLPTFYKRTGSAIIFGAVMLAGLLWNQWAFLALFLLINALCLRDYFRLMQEIDKAAYWPPWLPVVIQVAGAVCIAGPMLITGHDDGSSAYNIGIAFFSVLPVCPVILMLYATLPQKNALPALLQATGGLLYISLPLCFLVAIRTEHKVLPIALILMIWSNDTLAYLVGSFIGKRPFSPISPKKTWEGTIGGALLTITLAAVYSYICYPRQMAGWVALALCATVAGTLGDLLESKLKRIAGVKDSGNLMPGHGGALDRFDSLLVAAPFALYVYIVWFMA